MKKIFLYIFIFYIIKPIKNQENPSPNTKSSENNIQYESRSFLFHSNPIFEKFSDQWSMYMSNFVSQYIYSIPISKRSQVEYYENITKVPCLFQGAFILEEAQNEREVIEFKIISPNGTILFEATDIASIFSLQIHEKGLYTFVFNNRVINREIRPTLMVNSGQNLILERENLSGTESKLEKIVAFLQKYEQDRKLNRGFIRRGNEELKKTNKYFYIFSFIETIVLIAVSIWQYCYLKHLFEIKGSL